jgi:hypothetical protein
MKKAIDAEICTVKARLKHVVELHIEAIERLERWRNSLDKTLFNFTQTFYLEIEAYADELLLLLLGGEIEQSSNLLNNIWR